MERSVTKLVYQSMYLRLNKQDTKDMFREYNKQFMEAFKDEIDEAFQRKIASAKQKVEGALQESQAAPQCDLAELDRNATRFFGQNATRFGFAAPGAASEAANPKREAFLSDAGDDANPSGAPGERDGPIDVEYAEPVQRSGEFWKKIKLVYRKLALRCHPDKAGGSEELFRKVLKLWQKGYALRLVCQAHEMGMQLDFVAFTSDDLNALETDIKRVEGQIARIKSTLAYKYGTASELERTMLRRQFVDNIRKD
jgi:hypothetical protein